MECGESCRGKQMINEDEEAGVYALHLAQGFVIQPVLNAAIELDLLDIIAQAGPGAFLSPSEVASKLPTKNPDAASMISRIFRLLASHLLLRCQVSTPREDGKVEMLYGLTPVGKFFVKDKEEGSLAYFLPLSCHRATWEAGSALKDMILEGGDIYEKVHGMSAFQYMKKDQTLNKIFNTAMADFAVITTKKILNTYKGFEGLTSLVDVGGGTGATLDMIVTKYPSIKGINFDLPFVVKQAPSYPGVVHVGGDMFASVPKAETIMIKCVLHNWSDEECLKILRNIHEALPEEGKLIVMDFVLPTEPDGSYRDKHVSEMDCIMLIHKEGKDRTLEELEALCTASGLSGFKLLCFAHTIGIIECFK